MSKPLIGVILAAGQGTRMKSRLPKVLHQICGRPMLDWVVHAVADVKPAEIIVVVGHGADAVRDAVADADVDVPIRTVVQHEQLGTGDATRVALDALEPADRDILILPGDSPLMTPATLAHMVEANDAEDVGVTLLTSEVDDPTGYGRVIRTMGGGVSKVVEDADCSASQSEIHEVATSTYVFDEERLRAVLVSLRPDNAQGELYLPDAIERVFPDVNSVSADEQEIMGVNDRVQLAEVERITRGRILHDAMVAGVTVLDPATTYVGADVTLAEDVTLLPGTHLEGRTTVGAHTSVGPNARLVDTRVGENATLSYCVSRDAIIEDGAEVGPYASIRAGTVAGPNSKIGTFVEIKKAQIGARSKVPHLSYVGDTSIGEDANLGANTITCNYDGVDKHATKIGDGVHTGSGTLLVAPVELGADAYTGAGAVVTRDVPDSALAAGVPARNDEGWTQRKRRRRVDKVE